MDPVVARKTWRTLEPLHGIIYFAAERQEMFDSLGLRSEHGYFVTRAAAMGAVGAEVVVATFFNFHPGFVHAAMRDAWSLTTPGKAVAVRTETAARMLRRILGDDAIASTAMREAAAIARDAAEEATLRPEGRALFAGHAALDWPPDDEPHAVLWHAQTLLREYRGDAHVAALAMEGVTGCEALVLHAATGDVSPRVLQASRRWSDDEWAATEAGLRARGWLTSDGRLTESGQAHRDFVEMATDRLALVPYASIGEDECDELRSLCRPFSQAIVASGEFGFPQR